MIAVALGLWLAAGPALKDPFEGLPNVVSAVPVSGELSSVGGTPVLARAYKVKLTPLEAWKWVLQSFRKHDLYMPPPERQIQLEGAPQLTGYDGAARRSYTAIFTANPDGTTNIIAATADLADYKWATGGHSLPVMPGAEGAVESATEQGTVVAYTVAAKPDELDSFYAAVLPEDGWVRDEKNGGWAKAGQSLTVSQRKNADGKLAVTVMTRPTGAK